MTRFQLFFFMPRLFMDLDFKMICYASPAIKTNGGGEIRTCKGDHFV